MTPPSFAADPVATLSGVPHGPVDSLLHFHPGVQTETIDRIPRRAEAPEAFSFPGLFVPPADRNPRVLDSLFAALYEELRRVARRESRRHQSHAMMSTTTLVHEAYLDVSRRHALSFPDKQHFVGYVARAMRGLLIDRLRERMAQKRGGDIDFESLDADIEYMVQQPEQLDQIGDVLEELTSLDPELARVVDLRYLCGFSVAEVAALLDTSERTIHRRWEKARALLKMALSESARR